ncbi:hypothetical protein N185_21820 [Sinorhizobium sp. GW3]|nr:hypothetical protein N185_21820 [Sinorhizobium sp. GW3]
MTSASETPGRVLGIVSARPRNLGREREARRE